MHQITSILIGFTLLLSSCQSTNDDHTHTPVKETTQTTTVGQVAAMEKAVLATHDSAMADMSELMRLKKAVKQQVASVATQTPSADVTRQHEQGLAVSQELVKADEAMMDWMHDYNGDTLARLDEQHALHYLKDQQQKVKAMRQLMQKSMSNAKTFLR